MIFLPAKFFCQSNGLFHPKDLFAAFHDLAFQGIAQFPFCIPDGSTGDAPFQSRLVDVLAEHLLSSGKQGADQVFGLLGLGFTLRFDAGQHFVCGNVVLADPAETALVPPERTPVTLPAGQENFSRGSKCAWWGRASACR